MSDRPRLKSPFDPPQPAPESAQPEAESADEKPKKRFRFTIRGYFLVTFLVAASVAGLGGMLRGGEDLQYYILLALLMPCAALVAASVFQQLTRGRRRPPRDF